MAYRQGGYQRRGHTWDEYERLFYTSPEVIYRYFQMKQGAAKREHSKVIFDATGHGSQYKYKHTFASLLGTNTAPLYTALTGLTPHAPTPRPLQLCAACAAASNRG